MQSIHWVTGGVVSVRGSEKTQWCRVFPLDGIRLHKMNSYPVHYPIHSPESSFYTNLVPWWSVIFSYLKEILSKKNSQSRKWARKKNCSERSIDLVVPWVLKYNFIRHFSIFAATCTNETRWVCMHSSN